MGKATFCIVLGVLLCLRVAGYVSVDRSCALVGYELIEQAIDHVGVTEATGNNDGPEVDAYLASTGLASGYAWCGSFVHYVHKEVGVDLPGKRQRWAWSPNWFTDNVVWIQANKSHRSKRTKFPIPSAGDVFGLYYSSLGRIGHVGLIMHWSSNYVTTIEGNTSGSGSREGHGVYVKKRRSEKIFKVSRWYGC